MNYLDCAIADGHAKLTGEGKQQKILYVAVNHTERHADPEEQAVPAANGGRAQAPCGNGTWAKFRANYVGEVAGMTRRLLDSTEKYGVLEREANIIADLPRHYGKPEEYRFYKGDANNDIAPVSKETLIAAIKKCHLTLWGGVLTSFDAARQVALQPGLVLIPLRIMAHRKKKRSRGEPEPRRDDEFPERGAGVRNCGLRHVPPTVGKYEPERC